MASRAQVAGLADLLPTSERPQRRLSRFRLPFARPRAPRGLEAVPERYRLQLILMAADAMPGKDPSAQGAVAAELAERVRAMIPARLLGDTDDLDVWFKERADFIVGMARGVAWGR